MHVRVCCMKTRRDGASCSTSMRSSRVCSNISLKRFDPAFFVAFTLPDLYPSSLLTAKSESQSTIGKLPTLKFKMADSSQIFNLDSESKSVSTKTGTGFFRMYWACPWLAVMLDYTERQMMLCHVLEDCSPYLVSSPFLVGLIFALKVLGFEDTGLVLGSYVKLFFKSTF